MTITKDIRYIGVNDHAVDLFEGQYVVPGGMCYNSYAIVDEKVAIMDTVDRGFTHQWLDNIHQGLFVQKGGLGGGVVWRGGKALGHSSKLRLDLVQVRALIGHLRKFHERISPLCVL